MSEEWRKRLLAAIDATGRSDRQISLAARLGVNAVNELRTTPKTPSVDKVIKIADAVGVSLSYVFLGLETTQETEQFLKLLASAPASKRQAVQELLRAD